MRYIFIIAFLLTMCCFLSTKVINPSDGEVNYNNRKPCQVDVKCPKCRIKINKDTWICPGCGMDYYFE